MDILALLIVLALVILLAARQAGGLLLWMREEWRAAYVESFAPERLVNPRLGSVAHDDRVALMAVKQRALGKRMRRDGRSLLAGKAYRPALTKAEPPAKPAPNVVTLRRARS